MLTVAPDALNYAEKRNEFIRSGAHTKSAHYSELFRTVANEEGIHPMRETMSRASVQDLLTIALPCLILNGAIALAVSQNHPAYWRDYRLNLSPDAVHYVLLGKTFWINGAYSRQGHEPYTPDMMRTPVYPLLAGGIEAVCSSAWPIYLTQVLFSLGTAISMYLLGRPIFGCRIAWTAALICSADLMLAILNFEAMSEPLFVLVATICVLLWLPIGLRDTAVWGDGFARPATVGVLAGLAILIRPTGLYLPLVLSGGIIVRAIAGGGWRRLGQAIILMAVASVVVVPWVIRNYVVFGVPRLTTFDAANLVYWAGAGAYQIEHGISPQEAQRRIQDEYGLVPLVAVNNPWISNRPVSQIDAEMRRAAPKILAKYPKSLAISTIRGVGIATVSHNTGLLASVSGMNWYPPSLDTLASGKPLTSLGRLSHNHPLMILAFLWQLAFAILVLLLGIVGMVRALLTRGEWRGVGLCLFAVVVYYVATIAAVGYNAYARHRSMIVPLWCFFAALGLHWLLIHSGVARKDRVESPFKSG